MECCDLPPHPAIVHAGFGVRTAASLIDTVLMLISTAPLLLLLHVMPDEPLAASRPRRSQRGPRPGAGTLVVDLPDPHPLWP